MYVLIVIEIQIHTYDIHMVFSDIYFFVFNIIGSYSV